MPTIRYLQRTSDPTLRALLLDIVAIGLARPLADLLIGQLVMPERLELARRTLEGSPAVDEVRRLYAVHVAPQEAILAAGDGCG